MTSSSNEDKGVDLYVLERAFSSTHPNSDTLVFSSLLSLHPLVPECYFFLWAIQQQNQGSDQSISQSTCSWSKAYCFWLALSCFNLSYVLFLFDNESTRLKRCFLNSILINSFRIKFLIILIQQARNVAAHISTDHIESKLKVTPSKHKFDSHSQKIPLLSPFSQEHLVLGIFRTLLVLISLLVCPVSVAPQVVYTIQRSSTTNGESCDEKGILSVHPLTWSLGIQKKESLSNKTESEYFFTERLDFYDYFAISLGFIFFTRDPIWPSFPIGMRSPQYLSHIHKWLIPNSSSFHFIFRCVSISLHNNRPMHSFATIMLFFLLFSVTAKWSQPSFIQKVMLAFGEYSHPHIFNLLNNKMYRATHMTHW